MCWLRAVRSGHDQGFLFNKLDALLGQELPVGRRIHRPRVGQRIHDVVTKLLLKRGDALGVTLVFPVAPRLLLRLVLLESRLDDPVTFALHQPVVDLVELPMHIPAAQCLARDVVVVDDLDVVVGMPTAAVGVRNDQHVTVGVQLLGEHVAQVVDPLNVFRLTRIELIFGEALDD